MKLAGEIDESASDVAGYGMVEQPEVVNIVEVPQNQNIDRVVDIPVVRGRWRFLFS